VRDQKQKPLVDDKSSALFVSADTEMRHKEPQLRLHSLPRSRCRKSLRRRFTENGNIAVKWQETFDEFSQKLQTFRDRIGGS
jgi:hypothetical protein